MSERAEERRGERRVKWWEDYRCGCVSEIVAHKHDLLGYCPKHGEKRRYVRPDFTRRRREHTTWCLSAPVNAPCICERRSGGERRGMGSRRDTVGNRDMRRCLATCITRMSDGQTNHAPGCPQTQPMRSGRDRRITPGSPEDRRLQGERE